MTSKKSDRSRSMRIDRVSSMPLYAQVKQAILKQIETGAFAENERIPSESALCSLLDVSRPTVRQAVSELTVEGVLTIQKGRGTYVLPRKPLQVIEAFSPMTFAFLAGDSMVHRTLLNLGPAARLPGHLLTAYGLDPDDADAQRFASEFWEIVWLEGVENVPYARCASYIPIGMYPDLSEQVTAGMDLTAITSNKYALMPSRATSSIVVQLADQTVAMQLNCSPGTPVIRQETVQISKSGDICEVGTALIRSDIVRFKLSQERR